MSEQEPTEVNRERDYGDVYDEQAAELIEQRDAATVGHILRQNAALEEQVSVPEAVGSCSTYIQGPGGTEVLVTSRGASITYAWMQMSDFLRRRIAEGFKPVIKGARFPGESAGSASTAVNATVTSGGGEAVQAQPAVTLGNNEFMAERVSAEIKQVAGQSKTYYTITGGPYRQFGIRVWDEVLASIGIQPGTVTPDRPLTLSGVVATLEISEKGKKISRLRRV